MKLEGGAYMHTNGYFQLASTKDGLMITVYPPQPGGRKAEVEVTYFICCAERYIGLYRCTQSKDGI